MNQNLPSTSLPTVFTIERDWVLSLDLRPVMQAGAPSEFPIAALASLRGKIDFRFRGIHELVNRGAPSPELHGFLRRWFAMWPFFGWFAPAGHPLLALIVACCADSLEVVHSPETGRVQWCVRQADQRRVREILVHGILYVADLVDAEDDDWQAQVEGIDDSIDRFITLV